MMIYKILRQEEWQTLVTQGQTTGAPVDLADGFVHFSTAEQLPGTLAKYFAGEDHLILLALHADPLGEALRWEASRFDMLFPHLYAPLQLSDVAWSAPVGLDDTGQHILPSGVG
ncbi:MAG: DUF952 domain-containing protein [Pseudomonadota bacterium]